MKLFGKLKESQYIEEILGLMGILYLLTLAVLLFFLFRFLIININLATIGILPSEKSVPASFDISLAEQATKR